MAEEEYQWRAIPEKTAPHWLEIVATDGWRRAIFKWDGCIHYYRIFNTPIEQNGEPIRSFEKAEEEDDTSYIHICDIDEEIARLQALKAIGTKFFGEVGIGGTGDIRRLLDDQQDS